MKRVEHFFAAFSFIILLAFIVSTASANDSHADRKGGKRISTAKKHGPVKVSGRADKLKKSKLKAGRQNVIKGKRHVHHIKKRSGYAMKTVPAANSARMEELRQLTGSEDLLAGLSVEDRLVLFAKKMLRFPYRFGGTGSNGLDCSAYVQRVFSFVGQNIPRSAREQFNRGAAIDREDLKTGDLVFFRTYAAFPSHVGIYLGNDLFIHASSASRRVKINSLETPYYVRRYIGAKRIISDNIIAM